MEGQKYLKYCSECAKIDDIPGAKYHVHGYKSFYDSDNVENCLECGNKLIHLSMPCEDYRILTHISTDPDFMDSMVKLHDEDIIEYNLKMSQFKANLSTQKAVEEENKPHCPHCKSINIKSISGLNRGASIAMWGIFSKKINKSFECKDCGYTW